VAEQGGDLFQRYAVVEQGLGEGVAAGVRGGRCQPGQFCQPGNRQLHGARLHRFAALPDNQALREALREEIARALTALPPRLAELSRRALYPLWDKTLPRLARRTRPDLLADLGALVPVIHALGGEAAIAETARAIQDVVRWWP
jgi:hypothetical protein